MTNVNYRIKQGILISGDIAIFYISIFLAVFLRRGGIVDPIQLEQSLFWFSMLIPIWITLHYINGTYDIGRHKTISVLLTRIVQIAVVNVSIGVLFFYLLPGKVYSPKTILLLTILISYIGIALWRHVFSKYFATKTLSSNVLFIGYTPEMEELAHIIYAHPERGYTLATWITDHKNSLKEQFPNTVYYESLTAIRPSVSVHAIDTVVISSEQRQDDIVKQELYELLFWQVHIQSLTALYETLTGRIPPYTFTETWFLDHLQHSKNQLYARIRRFLDIFIGCFILLLLTGITPFIGLAIRINSKGSIFFSQERVGVSGNTFKLYKFRSMYSLAKDGSAEMDGAQFATKDDIRITRVGKFLRKSRIDELPQAINLLRGDISIIGPRPERPEIVRELESQMSYYPVRHIIKPGITGWAQVNQHYTDTLEQSLQKLQYDLYYIKNRSVLLDLSILLKTVNVVVRGMGQ